MLTVMSNKQIDEIKNSISRYLSMREHSKQELTDKLVKKNFNYENFKICINDFCEKDLQSDNRYAESFVRSKYNANKGPNFIIPSLKNKGVDMNLKPLSDRIVVKAEEAEATTASGIILPDTAKEKPQIGFVVATGPGKVNDVGNFVKIALKKGDKVLYGKYSGTEVNVGGNDLLIMRESDILATL